MDNDICSRHNRCCLVLSFALLGPAIFSGTHCCSPRGQVPARSQLYGSHLKIQSKRDRRLKHSVEAACQYISNDAQRSPFQRYDEHSDRSTLRDGSNSHNGCLVRSGRKLVGLGLNLSVSSKRLYALQARTYARHTSLQRSETSQCTCVMKLDVNSLRYLSKDEWRVLGSVELGQRNVRAARMRDLPSV